MLPPELGRAMLTSTGPGLATALTAMAMLLHMDTAAASPFENITVQVSNETLNYTAWTPCSVCCTQYKDPMGVAVLNKHTRPPGRSYRVCSGGACPQLCEISLWSGWSTCTFSNPWRNRTRYFVHPSDAQQGVCGALPTRELARCSEGQLTRTACSVYRGWSAWDAPCNCDSTTFQYQRRNRTCLFPLHLPDAVQIRPCITALTPDRPLVTRCNKPDLYACFPVEVVVQWSAWQCDAQCTTGGAGRGRGRARRNRLVGLFQADSVLARQELAVCDCPERHQAADCEIPCPPVLTMSPSSAQPATSVELASTSPLTTDSRDTVSSERSPLLGVLVALSTVLLVLLVAASTAVVLVYKRYKQTRAEVTSLVDGSLRISSGISTPQQSGRGACENTMESTLATDDTGNDDAQTTDVDGKLVAEVYINPHYRSPMRYPNYRDPYSESSSHHLSQLPESQPSAQGAASGQSQFYGGSGEAGASAAAGVHTGQGEGITGPNGSHNGSRRTRQLAGKPQRRHFPSRGHAGRPPALGSSAAVVDTARPTLYMPGLVGACGQDSATCYSMTSSAGEHTDRRVVGQQRLPHFPRFSNKRSQPPTGEVDHMTYGQ